MIENIDQMRERHKGDGSFGARGTDRRGTDLLVRGGRISARLAPASRALAPASRASLTLSSVNVCVCALGSAHSLV